jgi:triacylglycerol lipase
MLPVVLHHGLFGFGAFNIGGFKLSYFHRIDRAIADRGHPLIISRVHPTSSIEHRARQLKTLILKQLRSQKRHRERIIIIAHSMGGLDARFMITHLGMDDRVAALVTVCTPHRGSPYADWCIKNLGKRLRAMELIQTIGLDMQAANDLTTESCRRFNECTPDSPLVRYFSITCARPWHRVPPFFMHAHHIITDTEGENDGLVSVASGQWGEHLCTWPADHLHAINKRLVLELKDPTGDMVPRYMWLLDTLAERGVSLHGATEIPSA